MTGKRLVLYDFDGTLTSKDTLFTFIRYYHGMPRFLLGFLLLSPYLALFKAGLIPNHRAKERVLKYFFHNVPLAEFNSRCLRFAQEVIPSLIRPSALESLKDALHKNDTIYVVSASAENWVKPWCDLWNISCLATRLQTVDNKLTGRIDGLNCYGAEKVRRVQEVVDLRNFSAVIAFGDSSGDAAMLSIASEPHYRFFN